RPRTRPERSASSQEQALKRPHPPLLPLKPPRLRRLTQLRIQRDGIQRRLDPLQRRRRQPPAAPVEQPRSRRQQLPQRRPVPGSRGTKGIASPPPRDPLPVRRPQPTPRRPPAAPPPPRGRSRRRSRAPPRSRT